MNRRDFLLNSTLATVAFSSGILAGGCGDLNGAPSYRGKRLILLKLDGGNDGLFTFFQRENDIVDSRRPELGKIAKSNSIQYKDDWYLNASLKELLVALHSEELAILPYVGYPQFNTSHFKSIEIWETASLPGIVSEKTGWIGKMLDDGRLTLPGNDTPFLSLSDSDILLDKGRKKSGYAWKDNTALKWYNDELQEWTSLYTDSSVSEQVNLQLKLTNWLQDITLPTGFPVSSLGLQLSRIVAVIKKDKPFKVFHASQSGYDTHLGAPDRLSKLYKDLAACLAAFVGELKMADLWKDTLVFIYSEFGRTIDENKNMGTDHGTAGLCMLLGNNDLVRKYAAVTPELKVQTIGGELYLKHQVDFRDIYRDMEDVWLCS